MAAEATFVLRAVDATKQAFASVQNSLQRMTNSAQKLTSAFGVGLGVAGIGMMAKSVLDLGGKLNDLSIEAGMTTDSFQGLAYANLQNGLAFEQTAKAAENLRSKIQDAVSGNESAIKSFEALNLTGEGLRALSIDKQWEVIAISLANATDKQAAYNAIADIFGAKIGPKMKETLSQIAAVGFDEISKGFDSIKLTDKEIKNIDRAGDSFQVMFAKVKAGAASAFVGAQNYLEKFLTEMERSRMRIRPEGFLIGPMLEEGLPTPTVKAISPEDKSAMEAAKIDAEAARFAVEHAKTADVSEDRTSRMMKASNDLQAIRNANLQKYEQTISSIRSPLEIYMAEIERITKLEETQGMTAENAAKALGIAGAAYASAAGDVEDMSTRILAANENANKTIPAMSQLAKISDDAGAIISQGFEDAILSGEKLQDVLKAIGRDLLRLVFQQTITQPLASGISGALQGMFRANGGPVSANSPYVVGERGPELFVPRASGSIVSNSNMNQGGGSTGPSINVNYNIAAGVTRNELGPILEQERRRLKAEIPDMVRRGGAYRSAFA
jgi:transcriptional regulator with XRE-family HTH domain